VTWELRLGNSAAINVFNFTPWWPQTRAASHNKYSVAHHLIICKLHVCRAQEKGFLHLMGPASFYFTSMKAWLEDIYHFEIASAVFGTAKSDPKIENRSGIFHYKQFRIMM